MTEDEKLNILIELLESQKGMIKIIQILLVELSATISDIRKELKKQ